jgi:hypothetical protein
MLRSPGGGQGLTEPRTGLAADAQESVVFGDLLTIDASTAYPVDRRPLPELRLLERTHVQE